MCSCNDHGVCEGAMCVCDHLWLGDNCEYSTVVEARYPAFLAYRVFGVLLHFALAIHVGHRLYLAIQASKLSCRTLFSSAGFSPQLFSLSCLLVGVVIRFFWLAIDPNAWAGVSNWDADKLLLNIPLMLYMIAFSINLMLWMKLQLQFARHRDDFSVRCVVSQPLILKVIITVFSIMVILDGILEAVSAISYNASLLLYNAVTAGTILYLILCSWYFGGKVMGYLRQHHLKATGDSQAWSKGLLNMTKMVFGVSACAGAGAIFLVLEASLGCLSLRPGACGAIYYPLYRLSEAGVVLFVVSAVSTIHEDKPQSTRRSVKHSENGGGGGNVNSHKSQQPEAGTANASTKTEGEIKDIIFRVEIEPAATADVDAAIAIPARAEYLIDADQTLPEISQGQLEATQRPEERFAVL